MSCPDRQAIVEIPDHILADRLVSVPLAWKHQRPTRCEGTCRPERIHRLSGQRHLNVESPVLLARDLRSHAIRRDAPNRQPCSRPPARPSWSSKACPIAVPSGRAVALQAWSWDGQPMPRPPSVALALPPATQRWMPLLAKQLHRSADRYSRIARRVSRRIGKPYTAEMRCRTRRAVSTDARSSIRRTSCSTLGEVTATTGVEPIYGKTSFSRRFKTSAACSSTAAGHAIPALPPRTSLHTRYAEPLRLACGRRSDCPRFQSREAASRCSRGSAKLTSR